MHIKKAHKSISCLTRNRIYIILSLAFVPSLIHVVTLAYGPTENFGWNILYYHIGYETGFGGRKLLGSICHWIFPEFVRLRHIRTMVIAANILLTVLFILFSGKSFKKYQSTSLYLIFILYILGPFSIVSFMSSGLSVAFIETYQIALTLFWVLVWIKHRNTWPYYILTLLIATICCLFHHTFCCTLFPLFVGLFVYDSIDSNAIQIKRVIAYGLICLILMVVLVCIWKYSHMTIDIDQLNTWLEKHVAVDAYECSREAQNAYYYMSNSENRESQSSLLSWNYRYGELVMSLILLSPLIATVYYPWVRASHTAPTRFISWRYRMTWISITLLTLPIFFVATDYSRWFICFFLCMFIATMAVASTNNRPIMAAITRLCRWLMKHTIMSVAFILYLIGLHCTSFYGLREAVNLWEFIKGVIY